MLRSTAKHIMAAKGPIAHTSNPKLPKADTEKLAATIPSIAPNIPNPCMAPMASPISPSPANLPGKKKKEKRKTLEKLCERVKTASDA
jgi:hypothetical protein